MENSYFLGIDGGGTKCKGRLEDRDGNLLGEGLSGPCNPAQSAELALTSIMDATKQALVSANLSLNSIKELNVCLGLAGVNIPMYRSIAESWALPFNRVHITTDLHIACLGAHAGEEGAIIITGTGSSGLASVNGTLTCFGGHGFPLGDKASGAWLGWRALRYTLEVLDTLRPMTPLAEKVCQFFKTSSSQTIVGKALHYKSGDFGKLAPIVVQCARDKDPFAISVMQEGQTYLTSIISRMEEIGARKISVIGGLASEWLTWLPENTNHKVSPAMCSPEFGAVSLIKQVLKEQ